MHDRLPVGGPIVVIDSATIEAARYAVMHWHYSRTMPAGKLVKIGAWERGRFVGVVLFGRGAAPALGSAYGLDATGVCELVRVALDKHETPTTAIVAAGIRWLKRTNPGLRLIVSFADAAQGHVGTIYQAGNWIYTGSMEHQWYRVFGQLVHPKTLHSRYGVGGQSIPWLRERVDPNAERVAMPPKHRYLMPLDRAMRRQVAKLALPFPRGSSVEGDAPAHQAGEPGSIPGNRSPLLA